MYQLQTDLQKAQIQNEFQRRSSHHCGPPAETQLEEEVRSLRCQLDKAEKLDPVSTLPGADVHSKLMSKLMSISCLLSVPTRLVGTSWLRTWRRP